MWGLPEWYINIKFPLMFLQALAGAFVFVKMTDTKKRSFIYVGMQAIIFGGALGGIYACIDLSNLYMLTALMALIYVFVAVVIYITFHYSLPTSLLIAANGYLLQHIAGCLKSILKNLVLIDHSELTAVEIILLDIVCCSFVYIIVYLAFRPKVHEVEELDVRWQIAFTVLIFILSVGISRLTKGAGNDFQQSLVENLYNIICGFLFVFLQFDIAHRMKLVSDVAAMQQIVRQQYLQYEKSKENVQLVNEKYHDLKKMINSMKTYIDTQELESLEKKVLEYAPQILTGNEVVDVVLNEKRMLCEKQNIKITSLVCGSDLNFVEELDLYALFNNALENAINAVSKIPKEEDRYINLSVSRTNSMVVIHMENPYSGNLISENGLPKTNQDRRYHGFGMKSMERLAEKYGGSLSVSSLGNQFCLDIILFET